MIQRALRMLGKGHPVEPDSHLPGAQAADGERGGARRGPSFHMPRMVFTRGRGTGRDEAVGIQCTIGRAPGADIVVDDASVSRLHARIALEEDTYVLHDLGSRNGTLLNGRPIRSAQLADGDVIVLGHVELVFRRRELAPESDLDTPMFVPRPSVPRHRLPSRRRHGS